MTMIETPQIEFLQRELSDLRLNVESTVNPNTGTANTIVPIPISSGRQGFGPQLGLGYSSGSGNSSYGLGWNLSGLSAVRIHTKEGFPKYDHTDTYALDGGELVAYLKDGQPWVENEGKYTIQYFRNKFEGSFQRIELWEKTQGDQKGDRYWIVRNPDNSVFVYGQTELSRLQNPEKPDHIYSWLLEQQYDQNGNVILYQYKAEDDTGIDQTEIYEFNRFKRRKQIAQRYLKRIVYGNDQAVFFGEEIPDTIQWHFEVVLDYGEHSESPEEAHTISKPWAVRKDPFSSYGTGFEIRTWRLCRKILMFHHFRDSDLGENVLVGATTLHHQELSEGTVLEKIGYTGYRKDDGVYWSQKIPKLRFHYEKAVIGEAFVTPIADINLENMPYGLGDVNYKMIDLYGEGVPGILVETEKAWYYKTNKGGGHFGKLQTVLEKPSQQIGSYAMSDFDNNGNPNLVTLQGSKAGYYEYDRDQEEWSNFQVFREAPSVEHGSQLMDINGDGKAELVVFKQDRLTYYPSNGKSGFAAAIELAREHDNGVSHLPTLGNNLSLDYFSADMTGDGMTDQVRVLNGKVEYWSHLGNGKYTEGTVMGNVPVLEEGFEFDASRIRLVDLTGSGTSDLLYIGRGEIRYWINASGNQFVNSGVIEGLPYIDNFALLQIVDFLGNGTPCLVWSSALPGHSQAPLQYLPLIGAKPTGLLNKVENGLGMETQLTYGYSADHYLRDKREGNDWITHLPSHTYVVNQEKVIDHIGGTRATTDYKYHDGFYDGEERASRGFCFVEQFDMETIKDGTVADNLSTTETACIKTWFHNGALGWRNQRQQQYYLQGQSEYELADHHIENLNQWGQDSFSDAFRTLAGQVVRTEVYGVDSNGKTGSIPYQVIQNSYQIRALHPKTDDKKGCFMAFPREELICNYEKEAENPLINHTLILETDPFGIAVKQCTIGYPNKLAAEFIHGKPNPQKKLHVSYKEQSIQHYNNRDRYELAIPIASKAYEISDLLVPIGNTIFSLDDGVLETAIENTIQQAQSLRLWEKYYYWNDDLSEALTHGNIGQKTLLHHQEVWVGKTAEFKTIFEGKEDAQALLEEGKYKYDGQDNWWHPSEKIVYGTKEQFYLPIKMISPSATKGTTELQYDDYNLALQKIIDPLKLETKAEIDYHVLAPYTITDINENVSEVLYDPLGMVRVTSNYGSIELNPTLGKQPYGNNTLDNYDKSIWQDASIQQIIDTPERFLQGGTSFYQYDLYSWEDEHRNEPIQDINLLREAFMHNGSGEIQENAQIQTVVNYLDGFGRSIQSLQKVEAGLAVKLIADEVVFDASQNIVFEEVNPRWLVSGHVIYNKKQEPVKQYEPFFYPKLDFVTHEALQNFGETATQYYDALGRTIKTVSPDLSYSKTVIKAWEIQQFDANDTLHQNDLYNSIIANSDIEAEKEALQKAKAHVDTPTVIHLDGLGREVIVEEQELAGLHRVSVTYLDFYNNPIGIVDPRGLEAFTYSYDKAGRLLYEYSMDAGEKWTFQNIMDLPTHYWDGRGLHQTWVYDSFDRPVQIIADGLEGYDSKVMERLKYGTAAALQNANGQLVSHYDQAGLQVYEIFAPNGTPLQSYRQLTKDYKTEPDWNAVNIQNQQELLEREQYRSTTVLDVLDRTVSELLPDNTTRKYIYHLSGGLQSFKVSTADGQWQGKEILSQTTYNAKGQLEAMTYGNGVRNTYTYNAKTFRLQQLHSYGDQRSFQNLRYTYDPVGNITQIDNSVDLTENTPLPFKKAYTYDAHYQLTEAKGITHQALFDPSRNSNQDHHQIYQKGREHFSLNNTQLIEEYIRTYTYDLSGNRLQMRHNSPSGNINSKKHIDPFSNKSISQKERDNTTAAIHTFFDANGNRLALANVRTLHWNSRNNISRASIILRTNGIDDAEYYQYGSDSMRVRKVSEVLDHGTIIKEEKIYLNGCEIKRKIVGNTKKIDRMVSHFSDSSETIARGYQWKTGGNEANDDDKRIHYNLHNHLGSATIELSETQELISFEEYFPFGGTAFVLSNQNKEISLKDYRYSGKERDEFTGLYYYGYRYYAPWIGNWISPDPIGPEDGLNLYRFVQNNPVNFLDEDGLQTNVYRNGNVTIRPQNDLMLSEASMVIGKDHLKRGGITVVGYDKEGKYIGARDTTGSSYTETIKFLAEKSGVEFDIFIYAPSYTPNWEANFLDKDEKIDDTDTKKKEKKHKSKVEKKETAEQILKKDVKGDISMDEILKDTPNNGNDQEDNQDDNQSEDNGIEGFLVGFVSELGNIAESTVTNIVKQSPIGQIYIQGSHAINLGQALYNGDYNKAGDTMLQMVDDSMVGQITGTIKGIPEIGNAIGTYSAQIYLGEKDITAKDVGRVSAHLAVAAVTKGVQSKMGLSAVPGSLKNKAARKTRKFTATVKKAFKKRNKKKSTLGRKKRNSNDPTGTKRNSAGQLIDEKTGKYVSGPNSKSSSSGNRTKSGTLRNNPKKWKELMEDWEKMEEFGYDKILSKKNKEFIEGVRGVHGPRTPIVDDEWLEFFPEHQHLKGQQIRMHHVGGTPFTIPFTETEHYLIHGKGRFKSDPGWIKSFQMNKGRIDNHRIK